MRIELIDEAMTRKLGRALAKSCPSAPFLVTLTGELGAGKSHLVRAFLKKLGVSGTIPSPSYSLCETYVISNKLHVSHMDLYRLEDPEELDLMGFRDMIDGRGLLIEWPERAGTNLPASDLDLNLIWHKEGRMCAISAKTTKGEDWLAELKLPKA